MEIVLAPTSELTSAQRADLRALCDRAWADKEGGEFNDEAWQNALGGTHLFVRDAGAIVCHAAVIPRAFELDGRPLSVGYVEAVATLPEHRRQGHASAVMGRVSRLIDRDYDLGALATGSPSFYERFGWEPWPGRTAVTTPRGRTATPEADGIVLVRWPANRAVSMTTGSLLVCNWRPGDLW